MRFDKGACGATRVAGAVMLAASLLAGSTAWGQAGTAVRPYHAARVKGMDKAMDEALGAMQARAGTMKVQGVAVVAYFEGDRVEAWSSKMLMVGKLRVEPNGSDKGSNLLAIAYAKASEMADTLRDSGSGSRPALTGELGWQGGVIVRGKKGYLVAAFSGGRSEDDVAISRAGVEAMKGRL